MKVLLTGVTGYIGKRLLIQLLYHGHDVVCIVRDKFRFNASPYENDKGSITVIEADFLNKDSLINIPNDIEVAYYLIHSMSDREGNFEVKEELAAVNFKSYMEKTKVNQVIYLTGLVNEEKTSKHLASRKNVGEILKSTQYGLTILRAGIIVGSGSASFEIIRDLVEKLPIMIAPKWLNTKCQPIAVRNVMEFLIGVLKLEKTYNQTYDLGGTDVLTYKEMLSQYAEVRKLKRWFYTVPVMTPKLSSYWLYFVTSTVYTLAKNLVESMKVDVIAQPQTLTSDLNIKLLSYKEAIILAFDKIKQDDVMSTWYDSFSESFHNLKFSQYVNVPDFGCFKDQRKCNYEDKDTTIKKIFSIGGSSGWYYANFLWSIRGFIDKAVGGVGLRRGRKNIQTIEVGDSLDFWRVLYADKNEGRLLLFAEMKLPGEAWLEFMIEDNQLIQTATYRPLGVWGRLYWYSVLPFHGLIFNGMIKELCKKEEIKLS